ncbi:MAG: UvrD-helicase domain-containing protein [Bacilli bacterium]|nr:UvrD-helicase domain-containing protein [Bacilli bacterium]
MAQMGDVDFPYKAKGQADFYRFDVQDLSSEDYLSIAHEIGKYGMLNVFQKHRIHPYGHKQTKQETESRTLFDMNDWIVAAAYYSGEGTTGFETALIVYKKEPHHAAVVELSTCNVLDFLFEDWTVRYPEFGAVTRNEVLEDFGVLERAVPKTEPKKEEEEPAPVIVSGPFEANKKRKIPIIKTQPKPRPEYPPRQEEIPEQDEEEKEESPQVPLYTPAQFEPNRKFNKNQANRRESFEKRVENPAKEEEIAEEPEVAPAPLPSNFTPFSKGTPRNLHKGKSTWTPRPSISYRHDLTYPNGRLYVVDNDNEEIKPLFQAALDSIAGLSKVRIDEKCSFAPDLPGESFPQRNRFRQFRSQEWEVLALDTNGWGKVISMLLSYRSDPEFCVLLSGETVSVVSFQGIGVAYPRRSFDELLSQAHRPQRVVAPRPAEPAKPKKAIVPDAEEKAPVVPPKKTLRPKRRVFFTRAFAKARDRFVRKYHAQAEEDFQRTITDLITMDDESLVGFLSRNRVKTIPTDHSAITVQKFYFGTSAEYEAARLFFCRNYIDPSRHIDGSDFILLGVSEQGEHEEQGEIADWLSRMFSNPNDVALFQQLLPEKEGGNLDELAHLSKKQFTYLKDSEVNMPMAFLGSAGTGKTLISLEHYLELKKQGKRVLYLTYQKELRDEVRKKLIEKGATEFEALTYRDLCWEIFGEEKAKEMRTKKRYRKWFFDFVQHTYHIQRKLNQVGPTPEDQFMICYVFYRGIIDGARLRYESRRGDILSKQEFLDYVSDEEGFTLEAKETIYEVAVAYEKHLRKHKGTTDNKLAYEICALGDRAKRYDAIIIDEFQDLSEMQFLAIVHLLRDSYPLPLFIYGDENQAINPTIFGLADANQILRETFPNHPSFTVSELNDSFRSGPNLVHYINDINKVKRDAIGARSQLEEKEVSLREDEEDLFATLVEGEENLPRLLDICSQSDKDVVFVFPSVLRKDQASEKYASVAPAFVDASFLSVEEAKGREWDSVVLVDFFSSSRDLFDGMIGEKRLGKHSTVHRMLFNRFYVALTRARNRIVVFETNPSETIRENLLSGLTPLPRLADLEDYFQGQAENTAWKEFGEKLMDSKRYDAAYKAFARAEGEEAAILAKKAHDYMLAKRDELPLEETRDLYLSNLDYDSLEEFYEENGESGRFSLLSALCDPEGEAAYCHEIYASVEETLTEKERTLFFGLCANKYIDAIDGLSNRILRRKNHG